MCYQRMSLRTAEAYSGWARHSILFHGKRHPAALGAPKVVAFLKNLVAVNQVAASTHNQALNALVFLHAEVLEQPLGELRGLEHVKQPKHLPLVLNHHEVASLLARLAGTSWLAAALLCGAGSRLMECLRPRIGDVNTRSRIITENGSVRAGVQNQPGSSTTCARRVETWACTD